MVTADQPLLRRLTREEVPPQRRNPVDKKALGVAETIVEAVRIDGEKALRKYAEQFGELSAGAPLAYTRDVELKAAFERISVEQQEMLSRTAERIRAFALAQRASLTEVTVPIAGGEAGHTVEPVEVAGCYAPGGRYPLPSTVLMTAVTARAAGCRRVVVASPRPSDLTLAAAYVAHADELYPVGGAHAIGALAYGAGPVAQCDAVVGPGNVYVAAAKSLVAGAVAIDMIAGPSEVLVIADEHASAPVVAADLLAQAEHDPSASAYLISTSAALADAVEAELGTQLAVLPTAPIARQALGNSYCVVVDSLDEAAALSDANAPEHLELHVREPMALKAKLKHYGGLFVGDGAAEVRAQSHRARLLCRELPALCSLARPI